MNGERLVFPNYFMHFLVLGSKRGIVKPSYLVEKHSEIGTLLHILAHYALNTGEIVLKFAVYIVYNICKQMDGLVVGGVGEGRYFYYIFHIFRPWKQT